MKLGAGGALALVAAVVLATSVAGCNDSCVNVCSAPVFDLTMGRMDDMATTRDLAITSAGVVTVGAGGGNAFTPATVTIAAGQSVTWNWVSGFHSVISDSSPKAFADSPGPGQASGQFTVMFATAGTYAYHCGVDGATGTIVVQ